MDGQTISWEPQAGGCIQCVLHLLSAGPVRPGLPETGCLPGVESQHQPDDHGHRGRGCDSGADLATPAQRWSDISRKLKQCGEEGHEPAQGWARDDESAALHISDTWWGPTTHPSCAWTAKEGHAARWPEICIPYLSWPREPFCDRPQIHPSSKIAGQTACSSRAPGA